MAQKIFGANTGQINDGLYDAGIVSDFPTTNYNGGTHSVGDDTPAVRAYRFFIKAIINGASGIPAGATITGVNLELWEWDAGRNGAGAPTSWAVNLHRVLRDWGETTVTYNKYDGTNDWTTAGASDTTSDRSATTSATQTLDDTSAGAYVSFSGAQMVTDVQNWLDGVNNNYGWIIQAPTAELRTGTGYSFSSFRSQTASDGQRWQLTVDYTVPTPKSTSDTGQGSDGATITAVASVSQTGQGAEGVTKTETTIVNESETGQGVDGVDRGVNATVADSNVPRVSVF